MHEGTLSATLDSPSPSPTRDPTDRKGGYRPDIDGIRAIAVVSVVLFHLQLSHVRGGYVGVDVFFVLSGYLITGIIRPKATAGTFSFADFYLRRIRRLIPALVATVAATTVGAAVVLLPEDMIGYARSAVATLGSASNFVFYSESGYWDTNSDLKPLLHTWSLGVEEQFYLVWPALILGLVVLRKRVPVAVSLAVVSVLGLAGAIWMFGHDASAAFYLSPFRVFQFAFGALVGCLRFDRMSAAVRRGWTVAGREIALVAGLVLVAIAVFGYGDTTPFPGWHAVPVTAGAMLLLAAGAGPTGSGVLGRVVLENRVSVWIGRVSYSMYLAHWPVIALYRYKYGLDLGLVEQLGLAAATLVGTVLLHYGVERRFYRRGASVPARTPRTSNPRFAARVGAVSATLAVVLTTAWVGSGWSWRYPDLRLTPDDITAGMQARLGPEARGCHITGLDNARRCHLNRPIQVLVLGNSHEPDGFNFLHGGFAHDKRVNLVGFGSVNLCGEITVSGGHWISPVDECQQRLDTVVAHLSMFDDVLYAANQPFAPNKQEMLDLLQSIRQQSPSTRIITLGGYINDEIPCSRLVNETGSAAACAAKDNVDYFESDPHAYALSAPILALTDWYIDRVGLLCPGRVLASCRTESSKGVPMFYDIHHNSLQFAEEAGAEYARLHPDLLDPNGPRGGYGIPAP